MAHLHVRMDQSITVVAGGGGGPLSQASCSPAGTPLHPHTHLAAHSSLSQPALPVINPLPLPPRVRPPALRQRQLQDYLKSLNSMTRSIVLETETLAHEHHRDWEGMNDARREEVVNDHFIPTGVRAQYERARYVNIDALRATRGPRPFGARHNNGTASSAPLSQPLSQPQPLQRVAAAAADARSDVTSRSHTPALVSSSLFVAVGAAMVSAFALQKYLGLGCKVGVR